MAQIPKIVNAALAGLKPRQKEVLLARFGMEKGGGAETLAAIGGRLRITRERVRQIEAAGVRLASANVAKNSDASLFVEKMKKFLAARGGVVRRSEAAEYAASLAKGIGPNHVDFFAEASGAWKLYREDGEFHPFYYSSPKELKTAKSFISNWVDYLRAHKNGVLGESYEAHLAGFMKSKPEAASSAGCYLAVAKHVMKNPYGDIGLREWPEIRPSTVRDKIYLVMKKQGEPLHFEDIARHINKAGFSAQIALAPTVHNELIKDDRFVLVGRGMYGLRERGYEPGTAREVIARILKSEGPLRPNEVLAAVAKRRFFKPNTVFINLQNRSHFERMSDGRYRIRES